jgi:hypothetical protein
MIYRYRIDCWVNPKSGFELAEQNTFMLKFKKLIRDLFSNNPPFQEAIDKFGNKYDGMVLQSLIVETDKIYEDSEEEIIAEIKKKMPEAIIISHTILKLIKV